MKLEILVGMIASGKSTYARGRADAGALVVSHDGLSEMLHARYRYEAGLRDLYRRIEDCVAFNAWRAGRDVVADRTHLTRESRERWLRVAELWRGTGDRGVVVSAVTFPIEAPEVHARRRFESDPRGRTYGDWLAVARHHAGQAAAEPLDPAEGITIVRHQEQPR